MIRRIAAVVIAIWAISAPLSAQKRFEVSFSGGYTTAEGVKFDDRLIQGFLVNEAEVKSGPTFNLTGGFYATPQALIEFMYARQSSKLAANGPGITPIDVSDLNIDTYHVNFVYNWGEEDAPLRPYAFVGVGATHYGFGNILLTGVNGKISGNTQFSTTWGAGVKYWVSPSVGLKAGIRWTPTYIKSDPAGYWCDPFYGCWLLSDPDYSHQFEYTGGITFRF